MTTLDAYAFKSIHLIAIKKVQGHPVERNCKVFGRSGSFTRALKSTSNRQTIDYFWTSQSSTLIRLCFVNKPKVSKTDLHGLDFWWIYDFTALKIKIQITFAMKPGSVDILVTLYNLDLDSLSTGTGPMTKRSSLFLRYHESEAYLHTPYFLSCLHNTIGLHPNTAQQMSSLCN